MKKINNKGFAISTMLYGLLVVIILVFTLILSTMASNRKNSKDFVDSATSDLENRKSKSYVGKDTDPPTLEICNFNWTGSTYANSYLRLIPNTYESTTLTIGVCAYDNNKNGEGGISKVSSDKVGELYFGDDYQIFGTVNDNSKYTFSTTQGHDSWVKYSGKTVRIHIPPNSIYDMAGNGNAETNLYSFTLIDDKYDNAVIYNK